VPTPLRPRRPSGPIPHDCQPLECRNVALTADNTTTLAAEADRIDHRLRGRLVLPPLLHAGLARRRDAITDVHAAIDSLTSETGRRPSVLALATRLGLANTTFRRNYPDICAELAAIARTPSGTTAADA
jgi:hypothetical protein